MKLPNKVVHLNRKRINHGTRARRVANSDAIPVVQIDALQRHDDLAGDLEKKAVISDPLEGIEQDQTLPRLQRYRRSTPENDIFINAIADNKLDVIKSLVVSNPTIVNSTDTNGSKPLHWASRYGYLPIVNYLIEQGADVNANSNSKRTPLYNAVEAKKLDVVKVLIAQGADVNAKVNNNKTSLHEAARSGQLEVIKFLISKEAELNAQDNKGATSLHQASRSGQLKVVEFLIEKGAELNAQDNKGSTSLHEAVRSDQLKVVEFLIEKGAELNAQDNEGNTPLHKATASGDLKIVEHLIEQGAKEGEKNTAGQTPLDIAREQEKRYTGTNDSYTTIVRSLVKGKALPKYIFTAVQDGRLDIVKYLIEEKKVDVNIKDTDKDNWAPLHYAALNGQLEAATFLVEKGADIKAVETHADGKQPIHVAAIGGYTNIIGFFLIKGVNVNEVDNNGWAPLHYATFKNQLEATTFLVQKDANIKAIDTSADRKQPIHLAAQEGYKNIIEFLLSKGVNVNEVDNNGWAPLHYAAFKNQLEAATFLIQKDANII